MRSVRVAARASALSKAQVAEVFSELNLSYTPYWVETSGDLDKTTSLKTLEKTDFFTKEVDELVLKGICDISVHSAKDLPDPLP
ncbi:MAG: hydroxymethylbilane synthase, partial [Parachlamydiaceae bacterium]